MNSRIIVPGSCGELVQGVSGGVNVHITCPINRFARAVAREVNPGEGFAEGIHVTAHREDRKRADNNSSTNDASTDNGSKEKVLKALDAFRMIYGIAQNMTVEVSSELPVGKGMASSTAEIGSAIAAVAALMQIEITAKEIAEIALRIEPTDGVLFDEIVLFDHVTGSKLEIIGPPPPVEIIVLEPDEIIDTIAFNNIKQGNGLEYSGTSVNSLMDAFDGNYKYDYSNMRAKTQGIGKKHLLSNDFEVEKILKQNNIDETAVDEAIEMAKEGIKGFDLKLIGRAATLSARLNQRLLLKPELEDIIEATKRRGALGVNVAHSGSVIGILVESGFAKKLLDKISHFIPKSWDAYIVSMIGGGVRYE